VINNRIISFAGQSQGCVRHSHLGGPRAHHPAAHALLLEEALLPGLKLETRNPNSKTQLNSAHDILFSFFWIPIYTHYLYWTIFFLEIFV